MNGWTILPKEVFDEITQECPACGEPTKQEMDGDLAINVSCECGWMEKLALKAQLAEGRSEFLPAPTEEERARIDKEWRAQGGHVLWDFNSAGSFSTSIPEPEYLP